jgi:superfamily II DNA or RNA helicase
LSAWAAPTGARALRGLPPMYSWQREALAAWRSAGSRGVIEAVTGTGKTFVGLSAACEELARGGQVVVLVPTRELLVQWHREITPVVPLGISVGLLGDGHSEGLGRHDVLIAVVNSARDGDLRPRRPGGLLIADECHRYASSENRRALHDGFPRRLGLSATFARPDDGHHEWLLPYFGTTCFRLGYEQARREDVIAPFDVVLVALEFSDVERATYVEHDGVMAAAGAELIARFGLPTDRPGAFLAAVSTLARSDDDGGQTARIYLSAMRQRRQVLDEADSKNDLLVSLAPTVAEAERTLVFTSSIAAAERCAGLLNGCGLSAAAPIHSELSSAERRLLMDSFRSGDVRALVAPQVLDEGIDVASADLAIVLGATRSRRQMIQRMGRIVRRKPDGRSAKFIIAYITNTIEDPAQGAHEMFLEEVTAIANSVRR